MTKIRALGLLASVLLAGTVAAHAAPVTGSWKVAIGTSDAPCTVTLAAGDSEKAGTATADAACPAAAQKIARWSAVPGSLTLKSANGETIAKLSAEGTAYAGRQFADDRKVTFTPSNSSVAQSQ
ncbi:MAG TPA: AprI/Inh family metalloprotease inhibitor [Rhizomicrobium sp.]|nr:AprI/Inh family metalloprotease inhibitor [Rhizomicrobium sp.]